MSNYLKESDIIRIIQDNAVHHSAVELGIGDDCAAFCPQAGKLQVCSVDQLVCGTHFLPGHCSRSLGHKALAISISDVLAMGAKPEHLLLTITSPGVTAQWLSEFCAGLFALANEYSINLIGGNCTRGPLAISTTVLGSVAHQDLLKRSTAEPGDDIWLIGSVGAAACARQAILSGGQSILEQHWLYPQPQRAILQLAQIANAALDISDGLYPDLQKLCAASGCGADIYWSVLQQQAWVNNDIKLDLQDLMLFGGEDYAICVTISSTKRQQVAALQDSVNCLRIGQVTAADSVRVLDSAGAKIALTDKSWQHF
jgi:thiamine-monophosphate kinase